MEAIKVDNLKKTFKLKLKQVKALDGMTFNVNRGEIFGFLGPNGAGKSTTIKIITDLVRADSGSAYINGIPSTSHKARADIGFMPENPQYYDTLTGLDMLLFSASMFGYKDAKTQAYKLLEEFGLEDSAKVPLRKYSKGMIQRIGFAAALIHKPDILILDEPMSGLDPIGRMIFKKKMKELNRQGVTIFFSSHIIPDIEDICSRVVIVKDGKVVKDFNEVEIKYLTTSGFEIVVKNASGTGLDMGEKEISKNLYRIDCDKGNLINTLELLKDKNIEIIDIEPIKKDLEDVFIEILNG